MQKFINVTPFTDFLLVSQTRNNNAFLLLSPPQNATYSCVTGRAPELHWRKRTACIYTRHFFNQTICKEKNSLVLRLPPLRPENPGLPFSPGGPTTASPLSPFGPGNPGGPRGPRKHVPFDLETGAPLHDTWRKNEMKSV